MTADKGSPWPAEEPEGTQEAPDGDAERLNGREGHDQEEEAAQVALEGLSALSAEAALAAAQDARPVEELNIGLHHVRAHINAGGYGNVSLDGKQLWTTGFTIEARPGELTEVRIGVAAELLESAVYGQVYLELLGVARCYQCETVLFERFLFCPGCGLPVEAHIQEALNGPQEG